MLAAHRDQENLAHAHQSTAKQQPKTPRPRYLKTPLGRFTRNDENSCAAFTGKNAVAGTIKNTVSGKRTANSASKRQVLATPLGDQSRAPLGDKTTNANARPNQTVIGKEGVKQIGPSQVKPGGTHRQKQRQLEATGPKLEVQATRNTIVEDEPEYAPPAPTALPYQSDVLPEGGLTFEGLRKDYLLKGYYEHFYNPVDDSGVSRLDKAFNDEIKEALDNAIERNDREFEALDWSVADVPESKKIFPSDRSLGSKRAICNEKAAASTDRKGQTINSQRAASVLAIHSDRPKSTVFSRTSSSKHRSVTSVPPRVAKSSSLGPFYPGTTTGEAASRTTIGYSKGRTASSMLRSHQQASKDTTKPATHQFIDQSWDLTITPVRARSDANEQSPSKGLERPKFTSIFYDNEDDTEVTTFYNPLIDVDDDETFQLKLDM